MNSISKLLRKGVFAHDLYLEVKSFQTKLTLFAKQMSNENFAHFLLLKSQSLNTTLAQKYSEQITILREVFARRFAKWDTFSPCGSEVLLESHRK